MAFKIYTKTGDTGETSLFGGKRIPKNHIRIESYGTVDELNSHVGLLRDQISISDVRALLLEIQHTLFVLGSHLAATPGKELKLPSFEEKQIEILEKAIDDMDEKLPPLKTFILPGGHPIVSQAHICRCVCRRAERNAIHLHLEEPIHPDIIRYLNRLSDYFFTLARYLSLQMNAEEIPWIPEKS